MVIAQDFGTSDPRQAPAGLGPQGDDDRRRGLTRGTIVSTILAAAVFGLVLAVVPDGQRRISIDLWLIGVSVWAAIGFGTRALGTIPLPPATFRFPLRFLRPPDPDATIAPRQVASLEGGLLASADNARSYDHRLRPRLRAIAVHRLRVEHGIDPVTEPERATAALGDVAWLIDDTPAERPPTIPEMHRLLDRLGDERTR